MSSSDQEPRIKLEEFAEDDELQAPVNPIAREMSVLNGKKMVTYISSNVSAIASSPDLTLLGLSKLIGHNRQIIKENAKLTQANSKLKNDIEVYKKELEAAKYTQAIDIAARTKEIRDFQKAHAAQTQKLGELLSKVSGIPRAAFGSALQDAKQKKSKREKREQKALLSGMGQKVKGAKAVASSSQGQGVLVKREEE